MGFSYKDKVLIKNLYLIKGYGAQKLMSEFPEKNWKNSSLSKLLKKLQDMGTVERKKGSGRPKTACTAQNVSRVEELAMSLETNRTLIVLYVRFPEKPTFGSHLCSESCTTSLV